MFSELVLPEAAAALKASEYPEGAKDGQSMVNALKGIIADREAKKNKS